MSQNVLFIRQSKELRALRKLPISKHMKWRIAVILNGGDPDIIEALQRLRRKKRRKSTPTTARKSKRRKFRAVIGGTTRYRERPLPGHELGKAIVSSTVLGKLKMFTHGVLSSTQNITAATNLGVGTQAWERTWDQTNPGPPFLRGGAFRTIKYEVQKGERKGFGTYTSDGNPNLIGSGLKFEYKGDFISSSDWGVANGVDLTAGSYESFPSLSEYHTAAWNKTKPTVAKAGISQFLVELREIPQMLATTANLFHNSWRSFGGGYSSIVMHPSSVADNFLNHEFGWVPFINDLMSLKDVWDNSHKYIVQTARDNGTWMKRRRVLENLETTIRRNRTFSSNTQPISSGFQLEPCLRDQVIDGVTCKGFCDIEETKISEVTAVGSFRYYRPEFDDTLEDYSSNWMAAQRLLTLYGARINPTVLWKVTPWTWAIDWFTGVGDFISHHDEFIEDGIVSRYLYVMKSEEVRYTKKCNLNFYSPGPLNLVWYRRETKKMREVADSPYGFTVPWKDLSLRQYAILAAIGITRTPRGFISHGA